jgi:hypothetical protein
MQGTVQATSTQQSPWHNVKNLKHGSSHFQTRNRLHNGEKLETWK